MPGCSLTVRLCGAFQGLGAMFGCVVCCATLPLFGIVDWKKWLGRVAEDPGCFCSCFFFVCVCVCLCVSVCVCVQRFRAVP